LGSQGCFKYSNTFTFTFNNTVPMTRRLTNDEYLAKCHARHGNQYDYSRVHYVDSNTEVEIICRIHGPFSQKAISHHRGSGCHQCGLERVRQSKYKHDTQEQMDKIILEAIKACNGFPKNTDIIKHNLWDAKRIILKLGGFPRARKHYGYDLLEKPKNYWNDVRNIRSYLDKYFPVLLSAKQCPTIEMMIATGEYPSFIYKHGGIGGVCKKLNLKPMAGYLARDGHLVRSFFELLLDEYLYSRDLEHAPEIQPFKNETYRCDQKVCNHYVELWGFRTKKYEERRKLKEKLYHENNFKLIGLNPSVFINKTIKQVETELDSIFKENGFSIIRKRPYSMKAITEQVNYPWSEELVIEHIEKYRAQLGEFPTQKTLRTIGMSALAHRIHEFGGFRYFRKILKESQWSPDHMWSEDMIVNRLKQLCKEFGRFPKDHELSSDLKNAIRNKRYIEPKTLNHYRKLLGYEITKRDKDYWTAETLESELNNIIQSNGGNFPSNNQLRKLKRFDVASQISKLGGFYYWREKMGFALEQSRYHQLSDGDLTDKLKSLIDKFNRIPKSKELREIDSILLANLNKRGGIRKFIKPLVNNPSYRPACEEFLKRIGSSISE